MPETPLFVDLLGRFATLFSLARGQWPRTGPGAGGQEAGAGKPSCKLA